MSCRVAASLALLALAAPCGAQTTWSRAYTAARDVTVHSADATPDGVVLAGHELAAATGRDAWIARIAADGDVAWSVVLVEGGDQIVRDVAAMPGGGAVALVDADPDLVVALDASGSVVARVALDRDARVIAASADGRVHLGGRDGERAWVAELDGGLAIVRQVSLAFDCDSAVGAPCEHLVQALHLRPDGSLLVGLAVEASRIWDVHVYEPRVVSLDAQLEPRWQSRVAGNLDCTDHAMRWVSGFVEMPGGIVAVLGDGTCRSGLRGFVALVEDTGQVVWSVASEADASSGNDAVAGHRAGAVGEDGLLRVVGHRSLTALDLSGNVTAAQLYDAPFPQAELLAMAPDGDGWLLAGGPEPWVLRVGPAGEVEAWACGETAVEVFLATRVETFAASALPVGGGPPVQATPLGAASASDLALEVPPECVSGPPFPVGDLRARRTGGAIGLRWSRPRAAEKYDVLVGDLADLAAPAPSWDLAPADPGGCGLVVEQHVHEPPGGSSAFYLVLARNALGVAVGTGSDGAPRPVAGACP